jgi:hypothetical protein
MFFVIVAPASSRLNVPNQTQVNIFQFRANKEPERRVPHAGLGKDYTTGNSIRAKQPINKGSLRFNDG